MIYVLAGTLRQFDHWRLDHPQQNARYISDPDVLRGLKHIQYVEYGTPYERDDYEEIIQIIRWSAL
jgi:hypothetical protein